MNESSLIEKAKQYDEKIKTINSQFFSALDDYKKYYIYYNKNPEISEFQNYYSNSKSQLQTMSNDLFLITNSIDKTIEDLDKEMADVSIELENEKKRNTEMTNLLKNLQNTQNGSEILIDNSKSEYNFQYYNNVEIFIGILIIGGLLGTLFKNKIVQ